MVLKYGQACDAEQVHYGEQKDQTGYNPGYPKPVKDAGLDAA